MFVGGGKMILNHLSILPLIKYKWKCKYVPKSKHFRIGNKILLNIKRLTKKLDKQLTIGQLPNAEQNKLQIYQVID
jgi:hypothetical protein